MRALAGAALALCVATSSLAAVPEPTGFWTGPMHGETPASVKGGTVVDAPALARLIASASPVIIDVAAAETKPPGFPADRLWRPIHRSIPNSVWMPGAGAGELPPARTGQFMERVGALTGGDKGRPVVTFCHKECWASWNAAKRLVQAGYSRVYWFSEGIEGWQDDHDTAVTVQDPAWTSGAL